MFLRDIQAKRGMVGNYALSLIVVTMKLHLNLLIRTLVIDLGVSQSTVSKIWIRSK